MLQDKELTLKGFAAMTDPLMIVNVQDSEFKIIYRNDAVRNILGIKSNSEACCIDNIFIEPDASFYIKKIQEVFKYKEITRFEYSHFYEEEIVFDVKVTPILDNNGCCEQLVVVWHDISNYKNEINELQSRKKRPEAVIVDKEMERILRSERRFRKLVEMSPVGIIVHKDGVIRYVNSFAEKILTAGGGNSIRGDLLCKYIHSNYHEERTKIISNVGRDSSFFNVHLVRQDGELVHVEIICRNIYKKNQVISTMFFKDITLEEATKRLLRKTEEKYRLISNQTTDLISIIDQEGSLQYVSPSHHTVFGIPLEKFYGEHVINFVHEDDRIEFQKYLNEVTKTKQPLIKEIKFKDIHGNEGFVEVRATPIEDHEGNIETIVLVSRETKERRENEELLRKLDKLSVVGQVASCIAHEIRNPLTSIKGFKQMLEASLIDEKQRFYYEIISTELNKIESFVNKFMKLANPEAIPYEKIKLRSILENSYEITREKAFASNVKIVTDWRTKSNIKINCQTGPLKEVFVNILNNAIEASLKNNEIMVKITSTKNKMVKISIIDEGHGISEERLPHLGTPFYTTKEKGIGLGLTISFKVIREHHGLINVESTEGVGTKIDILLPCEE